MATSQHPAGPAAAMFEAARASRALGIELVETGDGTAAVRMTITPDMLNGHATAHGGYVFLLADSAFACACNSRGPVTVAAGAISPSSAPAREGEVLVARRLQASAALHAYLAKYYSPE